MKPKSATVSASSLLKWEECPQMWAALYLDHTPTPKGSTRGDVGTSCHYALEFFVNLVYIQQVAEWEDKELLEWLYQVGFRQTFNTADMTSDDYTDGLKLVRAWYERTDLSDCEVVSTEEKTRIPLRIEDMRLTYIFDRCDLLINDDGSRTVRVVDYKSVAQRWFSSDIKEKLQFKIYALCALIQFNHLKPDKIMVCADMLRHDEVVGHVFSKADCMQTKQYIKDTVTTILATEREDARYQLGRGCRFCPISASCPAVAANVSAGGVMAIRDVNEALVMATELEGKIQAMQSLLSHCDGLIKDYMREKDIVNLEEVFPGIGTVQVKVTAKGKRAVTNQSAIAAIVGPEIAARIGKFNVTDLDKLKSGTELTPKQKAELDMYVNKNYTPQIERKVKGS